MDRLFMGNKILLIRIHHHQEHCWLWRRSGLANISRLMKLNTAIRFRGQVHCRPSLINRPRNENCAEDAGTRTLIIFAFAGKRAEREV